MPARLQDGACNGFSFFGQEQVHFSPPMLVRALDALALHSVISSLPVCKRSCPRSRRRLPKEARSPQPLAQLGSGAVRGAGFFKRLFGKEEKVTTVIGRPTNFVHKSHIGFDPDKGFDVRARARRGWCVGKHAERR
jgi:hypothetical protein